MKGFNKINVRVGVVFSFNNWKHCLCWSDAEYDMWAPRRRPCQRNLQQIHTCQGSVIMDHTALTCKTSPSLPLMGCLSCLCCLGNTKFKVWVKHGGCIMRSSGCVSGLGRVDVPGCYQTAFFFKWLGNIFNFCLILWTSWVLVPNFMAIDPIVVEIFSKGVRPPADTAVLRVLLLIC